MKEAFLEIEADFLKALAQPMRLKILEVLKDGEKCVGEKCVGEKCVCEIYPAVGGEQSNISRHLMLMKKAGILNCRKEGLMVFYSVRDPKVFEVLGLVKDLLRSQMEETHRALEVA